jgi:transcriptional regulator with XRE-family HTH domain
MKRINPMGTKRPNPIDIYVGNRVRMRRLMLGMSQTKLGNALGLTFQQVQKYEKGTNRMGASRLQHIAQVLRVPISFFFEGAPSLSAPSKGTAAAPSTSYISEFFAKSDGLILSKSFMQIKDAKLRRCIVNLVERISGDHEG